MVSGLGRKSVQVGECALWEVEERFQGGQDGQGNLMAALREGLKGRLTLQQERRLGDTVAGLHDVVFPELKVEMPCETFVNVL